MFKFSYLLFLETELTSKNVNGIMVLYNESSFGRQATRALFQ